MSDDASTFLKENLEFSEVEKKGIVEMIKDIHKDLAFRKIRHLIPLEKGPRTKKQLAAGRYYQPTPNSKPPAEVVGKVLTPLFAKQSPADTKKTAIR